MRNFSLFLLVCLWHTLFTEGVAADPPNFLVIISDDLGYSDLGCYGGEIETPNLDSLAANGLRFTQFYNTARCWPSRAALLTGYYAQQVRRDAFPGLPNGKRGNRPAWARLLPEVLSQVGYRSYHSGKWHLDGMPIETGFHKSYLLKDQGRFFNPQVHWKDDKKLPPIEKGTDYYGTIAIADHAIECLQDHAENHAETPFFHYLAFTAPHFPLHALPEDIAKYDGKYDIGWKEIRKARWNRIVEMGIVTSPISHPETEIGPPYHFPDHLEILGDGEINRPLSWDDLTPEQQQFQADKMELHAAMVDRVDQEIGRVLKQLKEMEAFDNTLIMFLSDNGASAEIMVRADGHDPEATPGSAESYLCLGPGWSTCSNTPFRRHKTWTHEGGISTPFIAHWPDGIISKNELRKDPSHIIDIAPTLIDLAGTERFSEWEGVAVPEPPGISLNRRFQPRGLAEISPRKSLWWSHEANHAIRMLNYKAVVSGNDAEWELYDLSRDRNETRNLAEDHPEQLKLMKQNWIRMRDEFYETATGKPAP